MRGEEKESRIGGLGFAPPPSSPWKPGRVEAEGAVGLRRRERNTRRGEFGGVPFEGDILKISFTNM